MHPCFIKKSLLPGVCKLIVCLCVSWPQIGYGICDKEDHNAHAHIFRCLKTEVEAIVKQRIQDQQLI
jgi:hypothetical protein